jgi:hypothetical protein
MLNTLPKLLVHEYLYENTENVFNKHDVNIVYVYSKDCINCTNTDNILNFYINEWNGLRPNIKISLIYILLEKDIFKINDFLFEKEKNYVSDDVDLNYNFIKENNIQNIPYIYVYNKNMILLDMNGIETLNNYENDALNKWINK